ncbi:hypothetical protein KC726_05700 [Candidatus Woesebacteria bacterium]|nr:hypothetical protein [Candidatus Woesebacteria bacterium]
MERPTQEMYAEIKKGIVELSSKLPEGDVTYLLMGNSAFLGHIFASAIFQHAGRTLHYEVLPREENQSLYRTDVLETDQVLDRLKRLIDDNGTVVLFDDHSYFGNKLRFMMIKLGLESHEIYEERTSFDSFPFRNIIDSGKLSIIVAFARRLLFTHKHELVSFGNDFVSEETIKYLNGLASKVSAFVTQGLTTTDYLNEESPMYADFLGILSEMQELYNQIIP